MTAVEGDTVSFAVGEWFRGGTAPEVTLDGATSLAGVSSAGDPDVALVPGVRLLVAGDGGFAWACGFTQPWSAEVAAQWRAALGG